MNVDRMFLMIGVVILTTSGGCQRAPEPPPSTLQIASDDIYHIGFVVEDIDAAMARWSAEYGIGPFFVGRHFKFLNPDYDGDAVAPDVSLAFAFNGELMIELIEQHDDTRSVYTDLIETSGYGFHHIAFLVDDIDASVAAEVGRGGRSVFRADFEGGRLAYCNASSLLGNGLVEYLQRTEGVEALLDSMYRASIDWDGTDPVRSLFQQPVGLGASSRGAASFYFSHIYEIIE